MTDDRPWIKATVFATADQRHRIACGPSGSDRDALAAEFRRMSGFAGVPPGSIVRPRQ
jgi:hypothetical protein